MSVWVNQIAIKIYLTLKKISNYDLIYAFFCYFLFKIKFFVLIFKFFNLFQMISFKYYFTQFYIIYDDYF